MRRAALKAKGHPIGATGVSMHALSAMQLCGEMPAPIQVKNATLGGIFNMGGTAVANLRQASLEAHQSSELR